MDNESKQDQIAHLRRRARKAIDILTASRISVCAEHNERIRWVRDFALSMAVWSRTGTGAVFDIAEMFSPDVFKLLDSQMARAQCRACDAIDVLTAARRETCSEHNERIRKLRDFDFMLSSKSHDSGPELFDADEAPSPEVSRLLDDPTHHIAGTPPPDMGRLLDAPTHGLLKGGVA